MKSTHAMVMDPASFRHHQLRKHWCDVADYPLTQETRGVLCAIYPPVYKAGTLHGAFQGEPTSASNNASSADESQLQSAAVIFSQHRDAAWPSQVHGNDSPVEWEEFNAATSWKWWQKVPRPSKSSVMIPTSSFSWCTGCRGCELSPRFKWKSGMDLYTFSCMSYNGIGDGWNDGMYD